MSALKLTFAALAACSAVALSPAAAAAATLASGQLPQVAILGAAAPLTIRFLTQSSAAPEPATWAMMLAGFAGAGTALRYRARGRRYRLVESLADGGHSTEEFNAPNDAEALRRAASVAEGQIELWRGSTRIAPQA